MLRTTFLVLVLISLSSMAQGQARRCLLGSIRFTCPAGMKLTQDTALYQVFTRKDVAVFVASAEGDVDVNEFVSTIAKASLKSLFPKENQNFDWKPLKPGKALSKFETDREGRQGFNGSLGMALDYRIVHFKTLQVLVGYVATLGRDPETKAIFDRNLPADTVATLAGCELSTKLIYSITGEKFDADNSPCSLDVRSAKVSFTSQKRLPD